MVYFHKYGAKKVDLDGKKFASQLEASLYSLLYLREKVGELSQLRCQPNVFLTDAKIRMIPDFSAVEVKTKELVYFEAKGFETDIWRLKKKLWEFYGPGRLQIYKGSHKKLILTEELKPKTSYTLNLGGKNYGNDGT